MKGYVSSMDGSGGSGSGGGRDRRGPDGGSTGASRRTDGTLYVCATPIGNLDDMTHRAADVLARADLILAEDTRRARSLSRRFPLGGQIVSCHEHNQEERLGSVLAELARGADVALITDAGTPALADPGSKIVAGVAAAGFPVLPVPGASAPAAALSVSGFPGDGYVFAGFLPRKKGERAKVIERIALESLPVVFFEAPGRIRRTMAELAAAMPRRQALLAREMTKRFETYWRGSLAHLTDQIKEAPPSALKGEFTVVIGPAGAGAAPGRAAPADGSMDPGRLNQALRAQVAVLVEAGFDELEAIRRVARGHGLPRQAVYKLVRGG